LELRAIQLFNRAGTPLGANSFSIFPSTHRPKAGVKACSVVALLTPASPEKVDGQPQEILFELLTDRTEFDRLTDINDLFLHGNVRAG
jgi:hypothetical protein